jgi:hypothetical protein
VPGRQAAQWQEHSDASSTKTASIWRLLNRFVGGKAGEEGRKAYRVAAENVPGVRRVKDHLRALSPSVGMGVIARVSSDRIPLESRTRQRSPLCGLVEQDE